MHILVIIHGYPPTYSAGSEVYSKIVCDEFAKSHRVSVFTREENLYAPDFSIRQKEISQHLSLYIVNNPQGKDGYRHELMDKGFAKLVDQLKPDLAYIGHLNHLSTGIVNVLAKRNVPTVFMLHDYWLMCPRGQFLTRSIGKKNNFMVCDGQSDAKCACDCYEVYFSGRKENRAREVDAWSGWIQNRMAETKAIVGNIDLFIATSRYLRERFIHDFGIQEDKIVYLDYGFQLDNLKPVAKNRAKVKYTFGYIGTHIPAKGVNLLIEAFKRVKGDCLLKIFGRESGQNTHSLRMMCECAGDRIEFCGEYANSELSTRVFANVDVIVVPSIWVENSPLVIHEAEECHIPVITADFGGMAEYVHHKENGLLFRHRDVNSLADQMQWAFDHQSEMEVFGKRGYLYSEDGHIPSIVDHCRKLMEIFCGLQK